MIFSTILALVSTLDSIMVTGWLSEWTWASVLFVFKTILRASFPVYLNDLITWNTPSSLPFYIPLKPFSFTSSSSFVCRYAGDAFSNKTFSFLLSLPLGYLMVEFSIVLEISSSNYCASCFVHFTTFSMSNVALKACHDHISDISFHLFFSC